MRETQLPHHSAPAHHDISHLFHPLTVVQREAHPLLLSELINAKPVRQPIAGIEAVLDGKS